MSQPMPTLDEVKNWPATVALQEAARALGVSRSTAYEWVRTGQFPCAVISVGHKHRVITADLIRLLSQTGNGEASR